jgi:uncharacterized protein YjdB
VVVTAPATSLIAGTTLQLNVAVVDANGAALSGRPVEWASSDINVATVSNAGLVTAVAPGSVRITAHAEKSGELTLTIRPVPVATVAVSPDAATLQVGQTRQLSAVLRDAANAVLTGRAVSWRSSNDAIATVSAEGVVTAVTQGQARITATSEGAEGVSDVTVLPVPVASVRISPETATLSIGQTRQYAATTHDAAGNLLPGRTITWSTSNSARAAVSQQGVVTAIAEGAVTITATSEGKAADAQLTVTPIPVASVVVSPNAETLAPGQTRQLSATTRDSGGNTLTGRAVTWASSNIGVATVSQQGLVTAVGEGAATITATSEGKPGTATITVSAPKVMGVGYPARNGLTVPLLSFATTDLGNGYTRYTATYRQQNNTATAIAEGSLKLYFSNAAAMPQFGFFNNVLPGATFAVTRSYSFDAPSGSTPSVLQYDHDHFFAAQPIPGALQWAFPIR